MALVATLLAPAVSAQATITWTQPTRGVGAALGSDDSVYTLDYEMQLGAEMQVTKRAADGSLLWQASIDQTDGTKWERAQWIAVDADDNAVVCGTLMSGFSNPVVAASILAKFAPDGTPVFRLVYENPFDGSQTRQCLTDEDGSIYVLGRGFGTVGIVTKLVKFSPQGNVLWTYFDTNGIGAPQRFERTPDGGFVISARSVTGTLNGFAKVDALGQHVWHRTGIASVAPGDAAGDAAGNTFLVSSGFGTAGGTLVEKVDPTGATLWQRTLPGSGSLVAVGSDDAAIISGFPNSGSGGAAFLKVDGAGNLLWSNLDADGPHVLLLHARLLLDESGDAYLAAGTLFNMAVCKVRGDDGASAWTVLTSGSNAQGLALSPHGRGMVVVGGTTVRLDDPSEGVWTDHRSGLASAAARPSLHASGLLAANAPLQLRVASAPLGVPGAMILGFSGAMVPLFGGTLVPSPDLAVGFATDAYGRYELPLALGASVPVGLELWAQAWFLDATAAQPFHASNGRSATAP